MASCGPRESRFLRYKFLPSWIDAEDLSPSNMIICVRSSVYLRVQNTRQIARYETIVATSADCASNHPVIFPNANHVFALRKLWIFERRISHINVDGYFFTAHAFIISSYRLSYTRCYSSVRSQLTCVIYPYSAHPTEIRSSLSGVSL